MGIWVLGCMLYEFFNGCSLFNLKDCDLQGVDKDRRHIAEMYDVLGKMPKEIAMGCEFSEDIFDNKGRVIKNKGMGKIMRVSNTRRITNVEIALECF